MNAKRQTTLRSAEWQLVRKLFDRCLPLDEDARRRLLDAETSGRPQVRQEVESLLAQGDIGDSFLGVPMLQRMSDRTPEPPAPFVPQRLGKYLLLHRLGRGGMAEVYLAKMLGPRGFERLVAVKRVLPEYANDPELRTRFEYEARLSSRLTHANIVHIYDFGDYDGACLLAMELVNGTNLSDLMARAAERNATIPHDLGIYTVARIAEALEYAFRRKDEVTGKALEILHRDISPKNIMLSFDGEVKLVDFGIARAQDRNTRTRTGTLHGTVGYVSPEAANGQLPDVRSDVFSTCVVLYELLSGTRLFDGEGLLPLLRQIQEWALPSPRIEDLDVPAPLKAILSRGLTPNPHERYPTAGPLRQDLDAFLAEHGTPEVPERLAAFLSTLYTGEIDARRGLLGRVSSVPSGSRELAANGLSMTPPTLELSGSPRTEEPRSSTLVLLLGLLALAIGFAFLFRNAVDPQPKASPVVRVAASPAVPREAMASTFAPVAQVPTAVPVADVLLAATAVPLVDAVRAPSAAPIAAAAPTAAPVAEAPAPTTAPRLEAPIAVSAEDGRREPAGQGVRVEPGSECAEDGHRLCPGKEWGRGLGFCLQSQFDAIAAPNCRAVIATLPPPREGKGPPPSGWGPPPTGKGPPPGMGR